jgi:hypothetical protein
MKSSVIWDIIPSSSVKSTNVLEEHITSIFRVEESATHETSMKQTASRGTVIYFSIILVDFHQTA